MKASTFVLLDTEIGTHRFSVKQGEETTFFLLVFGKSCSMEVIVDILGPGAKVQILGIMIGKEKNILRLNTVQHHASPSSVSDLLIQTILTDQSRCYYAGSINIDHGAQKSNAYQKNQNLLLSKQAWADSRPMLEIMANDVRCTHGATVGTLDDDQLYYLATRGIPLSGARNLLIEGYVSNVLHRIPDERNRKEIHAAVRDVLRTII